MLTVTTFDYIKRLFPEGTLGKKLLLDKGLSRGDDKWKHIPYWPPDTFAAAAFLIDISGAYQNLLTTRYAGERVDTFGIFGENRRNLELLGAAWAFECFQDAEINRTEKNRLASEARDVFDPMMRDVTAVEISGQRFQTLQDYWNQLLVGSLTPPRITDGAGHAGTEIPQWWTAAIRLLIAADQAAKGLGFSTPNNRDPYPHQETLTSVIYGETRNRRKTQVVTDRRFFNHVVSPLVDQNLINVLPKSRTPNVGWTLRSLTHNLALLPPSRKLTVNWHLNPPSTAKAPANNRRRRAQKYIDRPLNILLVPYPYSIRGDCFASSGNNRKKPSSKGSDPNVDGSREFTIDQLWLRGGGSGAHLQNYLVRFVLSLVREAQKEGLPVNAIVFPEMALTSELFDSISCAVAEHAEFGRDLEFVVSGTSDFPKTKLTGPIQGNFVCVRGKLYKPPQRGDGQWQWKDEWDYRGHRAKHHRWKLDPRQIRRYGLAHRLDPMRRAWWEGISVGDRRVDIFEPRPATTLTTLICEDLARTDPVQEAIRAIGPSLVLVILMDGPQTAARWPAHYAGVLAEDPGSSVLTLTSFGMIARAAPQDGFRSRSIAFWKESRGDQRELLLPVGFHALLVSLKEAAVEERTLDGRSDGGGARAWHLESVTPLAVPDEDARFIVPR